MDNIINNKKNQPRNVSKGNISTHGIDVISFSLKGIMKSKKYNS